MKSQHYREEKAEYIEQKLEEYTQHTYLPAHNRAVLRDVLSREYDSCAREWLHEEEQSKHGEGR